MAHPERILCRSPLAAGTAGGRLNHCNWEVAMSIRRWLLLAGLLGAAACDASGPLAMCSFGGRVGGDRSEFASTGYQVCTDTDAMPQ
jgi:hypothetical protein